MGLQDDEIWKGCWVTEFGIEFQRGEGKFTSGRRSGSCRRWEEEEGRGIRR